MNLNIENLVRSGVVLAVGLPMALSLNNLVGVTARLAEDAGTPSKSTEVVTRVKGDLTEPCIRYSVSKVDSKLERNAKNDIDELLGGEVNYREVCKWVL